MRKLGLALLSLGVVVGAATGLGTLVGWHPVGWSWLVVVGATKLMLASSLGLMGAGAVCLRLDNRHKARAIADATVPRQLP